MANTGGLLGNFLSNAVDSYRTERDYQTKKEEREADKIRHERDTKRSLALQLAGQGLEEDGLGGFKKSKDKKREEAYDSASKRQGLLGRGYMPEYNEETGEVELTKIPGFKDQEQELAKLKVQEKGLDIQKQQKELTEGKKPSQGEFAAAGYAKRLEQAESDLSDIEGKGYNSASQGAALERMLPDWTGGFKSENTRRQQQAEDNFINAVLRRESGAAIAVDERKSAERQYFPRAGDTAEVKKQKAINRAIVRENMKAEAGHAFGKTPSVAALAAGASSGKGLLAGKKSGGGLIPEASAASQVRVVDGVTYKKVPGGWEEVQ